MRGFLGVCVGTVLAMLGCSSASSSASPSSMDAGVSDAATDAVTGGGGCVLTLEGPFAGDYACASPLGPATKPGLDTLSINSLLAVRSNIGILIACNEPRPFAPGTFGLAPDADSPGCGGLIEEVLPSGAPGRTFPSEAPGSSIEVVVTSTEGGVAHGHAKGVFVELVPNVGAGEPLHFTLVF